MQHCFAALCAQKCEIQNTAPKPHGYGRTGATRKSLQPALLALPQLTEHCSTSGFVRHRRPAVSKNTFGTRQGAADAPRHRSATDSCHPGFPSGRHRETRPTLQLLDCMLLAFTRIATHARFSALQRDLRALSSSRETSGLLPRAPSPTGTRGLAESNSWGSSC